MTKQFDLIRGWPNDLGDPGSEGIGGDGDFIGADQYIGGQDGG